MSIEPYAHLERWLEVMGYDLGVPDPEGEIVDRLRLYGRQPCPRRELGRLSALRRMGSPAQAQDRNEAVGRLHVDHMRVERAAFRVGHTSAEWDADPPF